MNLTNTARGRRWLAAISCLMAFATSAPVLAAGPSPQCGQNQRADIQGSDVLSNVPDFDAIAGGYQPHVVTLVASPASRPSPGAGVTYTWSQGAGQTAGSFSTTTGASTDFTVPDVGPAGEELTATLTITSTLSGCSGTWTDTVRIQVVDFYTVVANAAPEATATATPATVDEGVPVSLSAAGSFDPDGDPLSYSWVQTGGTAVSLAGAGTATATFTAPNTAYPAGDTLTFDLTVSDGTFTDVATVTVNVTWVNDPPVAALSCPASVNEGAGIRLDGSASADSDDGIASYAWSGGWSTLDLSGYSASAIEIPAKVLGFHEWPFFTFQLTTTDATGAFTFDQCEVEILDVTAPVVTVPQPLVAGEPAITVEADSAAGTAVDYQAQVSALDNFDGHLTYGSASFDCAPPSGSVFPLGSAPAKGSNTEVTCNATDAAGNAASAAFTVRVQDTTAPAMTMPAAIVVEATGAGGAVVDYDAVATLDLVDGAGTATCLPASHSQFALGATTVTCTAEDARGNSTSDTFSITVQDTTPPALSLPANQVVEATSAAGAAVNYSASALDVVDGSVAVVCVPASGSTFGLAAAPTKSLATTVNCSASDVAGNTASDSFTVTVQDTTGPQIDQPGDIGPVDATGPAGAVVSYASPATHDAVDGNGVADCAPLSGTTFALGTTTVTCNATDARGNAATPVTFKVTVQYPWAGFFRPIDNLPTINSAKAGSAIPVKFSLGGNMGSAIFAPGYPRVAAMQCTTGAVEDVVEETVTAGGSTLTYDSTAQQYVYVWKTDKAWAGSCRQLQLVLADGTVHLANFKLTK